MLQGQESGEVVYRAPTRVSEKCLGTGNTGKKTIYSNISTLLAELLQVLYKVVILKLEKKDVH